MVYYLFNGNLRDERGNGFQEIVHGAVLTTDRFGIVKRAYDLDGKDDFVEVPNEVLTHLPEGSVSAGSS